jgi:hypothetical protein
MAAAGTVTPRGGGNATAPVLGPGLIYLNGAVQVLRIRV